MVESIREMKGKVTTERRYYLTSLTDLTTIADTIRNHWSIENSQHWVLDVIYGEDAQKSLERNEKANKALLTRTALNLIRANGDEKLSVKRCKMRASQNKSFSNSCCFAGCLVQDCSEYVCRSILWIIFWMEQWYSNNSL